LGSLGRTQDAAGEFHEFDLVDRGSQEAPVCPRRPGNFPAHPIVSSRSLALRSPDQKHLLARARQGDAAAFQDLLRPHLASVRRFSFSFCKDWTEADDLAQEALLRAYRAIGSFQGEASITTWLYTIVRSTCIDWRRGRLAHMRTREDPIDEEAPSDQDLADDLLSGKQEADRLWAAIRCLGPRFRVPLVLCDIEGMAYDEIARIEGIPVGTVRSRISRARDRLVDLLRGGAARGTPSAPPSSNPDGNPAA
jgi:RNA polymerase sigma-70 factor, ECF subfamily